MGPATSRVADAAMKNNYTSNNQNHTDSGHHHHHRPGAGATAINSEITVSDSDVSSSASCSGPNHHINNNDNSCNNNTTQQQPHEQEQTFSLQDYFTTNNCNNNNTKEKTNHTTTWPCANCHSIVSSVDMRCPVCHGRQVKVEAEGGAGTMLRSTSVWLERVSSPTTTEGKDGGRNETPLSETTTTSAPVPYTYAEESTATLPPPPFPVPTETGSEAVAPPPPPPTTPTSSASPTAETDPDDVALDLGGDEADTVLEAVSLPRQDAPLQSTTTTVTTTSIVVEGDELRPVDPVAVTLASVPSPIPPPPPHHHHHHAITTTTSLTKPFSSSSPPILLATIPGNEGKEDAALDYTNDDDMYGSHEDLVILEVQTEPSFDGKRKISGNGMMDDARNGALAVADSQPDPRKSNHVKPVEQKYDDDEKDNDGLDPFTNLAEAKKRKAAK